MPRRDDYQDDYDDNPSRRRGLPFPAGVRLAGIIWIAFGTVGIAIAVVGLALRAGNADGGGNAVSGGCGLLIPIAFLVIGTQTVKGTATGVLGNGIGSIVFGLIYLALPLLLVWLAGRAPGPPGAPMTFLYVLAGISVLIGLLLFVAGGMAIAGRQAYTDWRVENGLARGPRRTAEQEDYDDDRRRRHSDEDDEDDRPRRRRGSDDR